VGGVMKKSFCFLVFIFLMFAGPMIPGVVASGPWEWNSTLQELESGRVMYFPTALFADKESGRYYVVDSGFNRLLSYDRSGEFLSAFTANNSLETPYDMVRVPGFLWVVEKGKNSLTEIDLKGQKVTPNTFTHKGRQVYPDRLAYNDNYLYLLDKASGGILSIDRNMKITGSFFCGDCDFGFVDFKIRNNKVWALEQKGKSVYRFSLDGNREAKISLEKSAVEFPRSLEIVENNNLFVLDRHRGTIVVFDSNGRYLYNFFEAGESRGKLYYPIEILIDPWGKLCVVEQGNGRVQVFGRR
jgi:DNA-binding beta-propeller fold protein YncE